MRGHKNFQIPPLSQSFFRAGEVASQRKAPGVREGSRIYRESPVSRREFTDQPHNIRAVGKPALLEVRKEELAVAGDLEGADAVLAALVSGDLDLRVGGFHVLSQLLKLGPVVSPLAIFDVHLHGIALSIYRGVRRPPHGPAEIIPESAGRGNSGDDTAPAPLPPRSPRP